ncbi:hypothetical protein [Streptomyces sp. NBC_01014]|uniref:hypothetical protein n=1 Tax=Streptomyces sp. NBC_01014 TaxID=2903719 RepID=UPI0038703FA4|nr:hypothetical protein OG282_24165 [Streptomyces sp. NBC_01014]
MDWDQVTLFILSFFGFLALFLNLTVGFLRQFPELISAWRRLRSTVHELTDSGSAEPEPPMPSEAGATVEAQRGTEGNGQLGPGG